MIPNVTITANTTGTTSINVTRDTGLLQSDLSNLTLVYNGLVDKITAYAGYNDETETGGVLQGDSSISRLLDTLRSGVTAAVPGFLAGTDGFTLASEIGLAFGSTDLAGLPVFEDIGKMFLDEAVLSSAISSDYRAVVDLIGGSGTGTSDNSDIQFTSSHDSTEGGTYNVRVDFNASGTVTLAMIRKDGETAWRNLTIDASDNTLTGQLDNAEQYLKLAAVWDTTGAYTASGDVRVRQGFGNVLYDRVSDLLDNVTGIIASKREHYNSAIDTVDKNIEFQQRLLETKQTNLEKKYARMETALAKLDAQRAAFDAVFASLDSMRNSDDN
ncbi:MAG: flagellar filament capping protein FliD [Phycisphaerae bacterium]|nr:flagellar filament capping protein FliD [Phycisphaerae bacterium]